MCPACRFSCMGREARSTSEQGLSLLAWALGKTMAQDKSTAPVPSGLTWEAYCAALGIDASSARQASLLECLARRLAAQQAALDAALLEARESTDDA